jgi:hypothetical protein
MGRSQKSVLLTSVLRSPSHQDIIRPAPSNKPLGTAKFIPNKEAENEPFEVLTTPKVRKSTRSKTTHHGQLSIFGKSYSDLAKTKSPSGVGQSLSTLSKSQHRPQTSSFFDEADNQPENLHADHEQSSPELQVDPSTLQLISDEVLRHSVQED